MPHNGKNILIGFIAGLLAFGFLAIGQGGCTHDKAATKSPTMTNTHRYIVQFVGFKTALSATEFLQRWKPFAARFKHSGAKSIDLYAVSNNPNLAFISRNIWDADTYFQNFPTGVAGSGNGGGIAVTQFGGYWISEQEIAKPSDMQLLFTNEHLASTARKRCTERVLFAHQLELTGADSALVNTQASNILFCTHLKTM